MLKPPSVDICIESPKQSEFVNFVSNKSDYILGRGSYGRVYKAVYKGKLVAVKIIRKINQQISDSVNRESNILGWSHANIIKILKITSLSDCFTIIMERFPSPSICLQHLLDEMKLTLYHGIRKVYERRWISSDVISGLRFCHSNNLVHLDVKPQNILIAFEESKEVNSLRTNYVCKLFDFGCSMFVDKNNIRHSHQHGTVRYMSPDILQGNPIGLHDDIYSFGITMWQLRTNKHPYHKITSNEVVAYHVVKSKLRPDSRTKFLENDENILPLMNKTSPIDSSSSCGKRTIVDSSSNRNQKSDAFLTPTFKRKPLVAQFLSVGHLNKHPTNRSSLTQNIIKKLDFDVVQYSDKKLSPFTPRVVNRNVRELGMKIYDKSEDRVETHNYRKIFQEFHPILPKEREIQIQNEYARIYKKCWEQNASERPSAEIVFNFLNLIFDLLK